MTEDAKAKSGTETTAPGPAGMATFPPAHPGEDDYPQFQGIDPRHYVIGAEIARGGMGRILAARDRRLGRPVAIKELLGSLGESGDLRARFEREARITANLQHPGIMHILEAGTWPTGEPFYVMKLVTGESLDKAIAARPTLDARLGLLANVIATVDALAYAHSMRVIHRDLKPANVLVGEFGETVVIDWGLAKDLADDRSSPEISVGPYRSAPGATVAGAIMGTPKYMPAEQARGDAVDERADVYALGAMLYHVLAGAPPYAGNTIQEVLAAVIAGPPPPLAATVSGVPPDLVTIVNKAMAHAAADRYPSAKELAADLKKFQTGQLVGAHHYSAWQLLRRWLRRYRTPVAVAGVALVLLVALGAVSLWRIVGEQARTEEQRQTAEQRRREAEDLTDFMMGEMREKLAPLAKLDLLLPVAKKAVQYYEGRPETGSDDEQHKRSQALMNVADVLASQGDRTEALRQYRAALAIRQLLAAKDPTNDGRRLDISVSHSRIAQALQAHGDLPGALGEFRASQDIVVELAAKEPTNDPWQLRLSTTYEKVGAVHFAQGDLPGALAQYRLALPIRQRLAAKDPTNDEWQLALWVVDNSVGDVLAEQGELAKALEEYRAGRVIMEKLAAKDPDSEAWRRNLSLSHDRIGVVSFDQGDLVGALREYRASLAIMDKLAAQDTTNTGWQSDLSVSHELVGDVLFKQGDLVGAHSRYRNALAIRQRLVAKDPINADWQRELSVSHNKVGNVFEVQGDRVGALREFRASLAIRQTLAAKDPTNDRSQRDLSVSHTAVGEMLLAQGALSAALGEYRANLAIRKMLAEKDPTHTGRQSVVAVSLGKVGDVLLQQRKAAEALEEYRASLAIMEGLTASDPTNAEWSKAASEMRRKVATCCGPRRD